MKPKILTITAYGSYRNSETIDFQQFDNSVFLIDGPTGSGKTTIFDAICFALYGQPSGNTRKANTVRSTYADPTIETWVDFTFTYRDKEYRIIRKPEQLLKSKKKNKTELVTSKATIQLTGDGLKPITNIKQANETIEQIIGLDKSQFEQTMMIVQGDFKKMINTETKDRQKIFRQILKTFDLEEFTEKLKDEDSKANEKIKVTTISIINLLKSFTCDDSSFQDILNSKEAGDRIEELLAIADKTIQEENAEIVKQKNEVISKDNEKNALLIENTTKRSSNTQKAEYLKTLSEYSALQEKEPEMINLSSIIERANKAKEIIPLDKKVKELEEELRRLKEERTEIEIKLPEAILLTEKSKKEYEEKSKIISIENEELTRKEKDYTDILSLLTTYDDTKKLLLNSQSAFSKEQAEIVSLNAMINEAKQQRANLENEITTYSGDRKIADYEASIKELKETEKEYSSLKEKKEKEYSLALNELSLNQKTYSDSFRKFTLANDEYNHANEIFLNDQAGILALTLKENIPCPVCGSLTHPSPCHLEKTSNYSKNDIDSLKATMEDKRVKAEADSSKAMVSKETVKNILNSLKSDYESLTSLVFDLDSFDKNINALVLQTKEKLNENSALLATAKGLEIKHKEDIRKLAQLKNNLDTILEPKLHLAEQILSQELAEKSKFEEQVNSLANKIGSQSKEEIDSSLKLIKEKKDHNRTIVNQLLDDSNSALKKQTSLSTTKLANDTNLPKTENRLNESKQELDSKVKENGFASAIDALRQSLDFNTQQQYEEKVKNFNSSMSAKKALLQQYTDSGIDKWETIDEEMLLNQENNLKNEYSILNSQYSSLVTIRDTNQRIRSEIDKFRKDFTADYEKAVETHRLYQTASGTLQQNLKLSFEVFYQSQIFEEILFSASKKFNTMSDGLFEMSKAEPASGQGQSGLDIDVLNTNNGKVLSVSSLSGGESFMASLALALSLSEVIQRKAGGIELDSMFIDEGFGSLDPASLSNAMKILNSLSSSSQRMIGIISHVDTLKSSIAKQIQVDKTISGSKIKIIY
ncbi:MAG: SMC family ATPase [Bacilli bacterium]